jgi:hypothetical protein
VTAWVTADPADEEERPVARPPDRWTLRRRAARERRRERLDADRDRYELLEKRGAE